MVRVIFFAERAMEIIVFKTILANSRTIINEGDIVNVGDTHHNGDTIRIPFAKAIIAEVNVVTITIINAGNRIAILVAVITNFVVFDEGKKKLWISGVNMRG